MKIITKNKRAYFDYEFSRFYEAGIVLQGHEVKSVKTSNINIIDAIARIQNNDIVLKNLDIPLYKKTSLKVLGSYEPKRDRNLLLKKSEILRMSGLLDKPGNVIVPLMVYIASNGKIKLKIGIGKLKRKIEKKQIIRDRDINRQMDRDIKSMRH